jgi:hypothetical protein
MTRTGLLPLLLLALLSCGAVAAIPPPGAGHVEAGRRIYLEGVLPDGRPLRGRRADGAVIMGAEAACVQCHRPSGMGGVEGDIQAPPVTGHALFGTGDKVVATMDPRTGKAFNRAHDPYTDQTVAEAIRSGRRVDGAAMQVLMPRYELRDTDMMVLVAYLRQLSTSRAPGVEDAVIHFATVVTPDVSAERRAVFVDMVQKIVAQKNGSTTVAGRDKSRHHMTSAAELVLGTERRWALDIWELQGSPDTWAAQLDRYYAAHPVFALVSGLGGADWSPVDAFCEREAVPCWFPSVALPPAAAPRHSLYFSRGVALEASLVAASLREQAESAPRRVIQVYRDEGVGRGAATELKAALAGSGITVEDRVLTATSGLDGALAGIGGSDALMLWLPPADIAKLGAGVPPAMTFLSGVLGGGERMPLPSSWRPTAKIVYPYELPARRAANLAYFKAWLNQRRVPLVDELMQSEVYFSFAFLTDTVAEMLDNLHRDYLIERAETMIGRREGGKAEAEYYSSTQSHVRTHSQTPDGVIAAQPVSAESPGLKANTLAGSSFRQREGTSAYPRLTLGPGQRFASKGGYIVHFDKDDALVVDEPWRVP